VVFVSRGSSLVVRRTPRITRRHARRLMMKSSVSAVGCMRLLGGDATMKERGARNRHDSQAPAQTGELNHAARSNRNLFFREDTGLKL
jgi:hypothetical protein